MAPTSHRVERSPSASAHSRAIKRLLVLTLLLVAAVGIGPRAAAQTDSEVRAYNQVVQQFRGGDLLALERWVAAAPQGFLRTNGTQLLIWEYRRMGDSPRAQRWATELLSVQPNNPLALAIMANSPSLPLTETSPHEPGADQALSMAKRALRGIDQMKPIEGMPESTFYAMKDELRRSLEGAIGYAYYQRNDYVTAREYLRRSVASSPRNAQFTYALAISDLYGNPPDEAEGYQMLARAVNLSQGTPAGNELARFAWERFYQAGGTREAWQDYLANTRVPPPPQEPAEQPVIEARATPPATVASAPSAAPATNVTGGTAAAASAPPAAAAPTTPTTTTPAVSAPDAAAPTTTAPTGSAPTSGATVASSAATRPSAPATTTAPTTTGAPASTPATSAAGTAAPPASTPVTTASAAPAPTSTAQPAAVQQPAAQAPAAAPASAPPAAQPTAAPPPQRDEPVEIARATPPDVTRPPVAPPRPKREIVPVGAPVSVGILIETATTTGATREAVINSLTDMVRRMRDTDEAFVMSFSDELAFEQDLTDNAQALGEAMDNIKPVSGTALYDAVAFASGHLKRVARNNKRVLIVVSDGTNRTNRISPLELSGQLNLSGVEIYCIGVGANTTETQYRLQALADRTGGRALLTSDVGQFRRATQQVAQAIGIPF